MNTRPSLEGTKLAETATYEQARHLVDRLAQDGYPLKNLTIVGKDLSSAEFIVGKLTGVNVFLAGALNGAWLGLLAGLLMTFTVQERFQYVVLPVAILGLAIISGCVQMLVYSFGARKNQFRSRTTLVAGRYELYTRGDVAWARRTLGLDANVNVAPVAAVQTVQPAAPTTDEKETAPSRFGSRPDEEPKFGVRLSPQEKAKLQGAHEPANPETYAPPADLSDLPPADEKHLPGSDDNPFKPTGA